MNKILDTNFRSKLICLEINFNYFLRHRRSIRLCAEEMYYDWEVAPHRLRYFVRWISLVSGKTRIRD